MPNRNIYLKTEQHDRMLMFRNVNWSEVCQEAVDQKLREMELEAEKTWVYESHNAMMI